VYLQLRRSPCPFAVDLDTPIQLHCNPIQCSNASAILCNACKTWHSLHSSSSLYPLNVVSHSIHRQSRIGGNGNLPILPCIRRRYIGIVYTTSLLNPFCTTVVADHMGDPYVLVTTGNFDTSTITGPWPIPAYLTRTFLFHMSTPFPKRQGCTGA
jgi:hypothetical protein